MCHSQVPFILLKRTVYLQFIYVINLLHLFLLQTNGIIYMGKEVLWLVYLNKWANKKVYNTKIWIFTTFNLTFNMANLASTKDNQYM